MGQDEKTIVPPSPKVLEMNVGWVTPRSSYPMFATFTKFTNLCWVFYEFFSVYWFSQFVEIFGAALRNQIL